MNESLEQVVTQAIDGDKQALDQIINQIQSLIYNLSLKMLWHPEDAQDATQEILIKVITNLSSFRGDSAFTTWVYKISSNTLLNFKQKKWNQTISFDEFQEQLLDGISDSIGYTQNKAEQNLLTLEAKVGCSHAMLQCLNRESRVVYILGEILELTSQEGAVVLNLSPENFRQKLSRVRKKIQEFVNTNCGLVNSSCACRCDKKVDSSIQKGMIQPKELLFVERGEGHSLIEEIDSIQSEVNLFQSNPKYNTPEVMLTEIKNTVLGRNSI